MEQKKNSLNISAKSFIAAIVIIFLLMVVTYALTFLIPGGEYPRTVDEAGHTIIDTQAGFREVEGGLPFWKWLLSPFLVLGAEGSGALIAVIAFLLVIGGVFNALNECGLMGYMLQKLVHRFGAVRYRLMAVLILFFMAMGSLVGSFEEVVPLVPIVTALAVGLGWDVLTGVAMSLLAAGCGFNRDPLTAAASAAWITGRAGELAEAEVGAVSMVAGDTVKKLPAAILELCGK